MILPEKIILIGYRACGKTTVGRLLAKRLGWRFVDTDQKAEEVGGMTIARLVAEQGWDAFRRLEKKLLLQLAGTKEIVVATGGGVVLHGEVWPEFARNSAVIWLQAPIAVIRRRLVEDDGTADTRPSLTGTKAEDEIASVLDARAPLYEKLSHLAVATEGKTPAVLAAEILTSGLLLQSAP